MQFTNARSKSPSDLRKFKDLVEAGERLEKQGKWDKSKAYFNAALAMVLAKRVWFVPA